MLRSLLFMFACWAGLLGAEVELMDGEVMVGEIVAESPDAVTIAITEHKMKVEMKLPAKRIHRIRADAEATWRIITAKGGGATTAGPTVEDPPAKQDDPGPPATIASSTPPGRFGWRRDGSGHYPAGKAPKAFTVKWQAAMPGWTQSSPVIVGDRIFVLSQPTWLICLDAVTGEELWRQETSYDAIGQAGKELPRSDFVMKTYGYTCPTPVTDGTWIWCSFGHGVVACYSLAGERKWASPYRIEGKQRSGVSQSPALCGSLVVIGGAADDAFAGYDRETGEHKWSISRGGGSRGKGSFQTVTVDGTEYILASDGMVISEAGQVVQEGLIDQRNYGPTPVVHDGVVYIYDNMGNTFMAGRLSPGKPTEILWRYPTEKDEGLSRSPLYHDGLIYLPGGSMAVLDAATGKRVHKFKVESSWSSPVLAGNRIVMVGDKNIMVIKPGREASIEAQFPHPFKNKGGSDWRLGCTPIFAHGLMYHRGAEALWALSCE